MVFTFVTRGVSYFICLWWEKMHSNPPLLRWNVQDIVATNEGIAVFILQLAVGVLFGLIECNVHVTVQASQHSCAHGHNDGKGKCEHFFFLIWSQWGKQTSVVNAAVQFNDDWATVNLVDELRKGFFARHLWKYVYF